MYEAYRNIRVKVLNKYIDSGFLGLFKKYYLEVQVTEPEFKPAVWTLPTSIHTFSRFSAGTNMYIQCYFDGNRITPVLS